MLCRRFGNKNTHGKVEFKAVLWFQNDLFRIHLYDFWEFQIRILPILFKHIWKSILKKPYNHSKRSVHQLSAILYFTVEKIILKHCTGTVLQYNTYCLSALSFLPVPDPNSQHCFQGERLPICTCSVQDPRPCTERFPTCVDISLKESYNKSTVKVKRVQGQLINIMDRPVNTALIRTSYEMTSIDDIPQLTTILL